MPTILRFRGFNIMVYTEDHEPPHVHARGKGKEAIFILGCNGGPVTMREEYGVTPAEQSALLRFIEENQDILCEAWKELHGSAGLA